MTDPDLEARRHAAYQRVRREIYEDAKAIISGHIAMERVNSRVHVIRKQGFSGNAAR